MHISNLKYQLSQLVSCQLYEIILQSLTKYNSTERLVTCKGYTNDTSVYLFVSLSHPALLISDQKNTHALSRRAYYRQQV